MQRLIKLSNTIVPMVVVAMALATGCKEQNLFEIVLREYKDKSIRSPEGIEGTSFYTYYDGKFLAIIKNDTVRSKRIIFGRLIGNFYGHQFEFTDENLLNRYTFNCGDGKHYTYGIEPSKDGKLSEIGSPSVDHWRDESYSSNDSTRYIFFFSRFPRKTVQAFYSYDSANYYSLRLENSKVMPYLLEGEIIIPNSVKTINLKIEADNLMYRLTGLQEKRSFVETEILN